MAAAHVNPCLLVGWDTDACKVVCVPFDQEWFMQMFAMLSRILLAAAPLAGKRPDLTTIPGHKKFVEFTTQRRTIAVAVASKRCSKTMVYT